jgi:hypothetical protein
MDLIQFSLSVLLLYSTWLSLVGWKRSVNVFVAAAAKEENFSPSDPRKETQFNS